MKSDRGNKLFAAFARRRPVRFAVIVYFFCFGIVATLADIGLVPDRPRALYYTTPLAFALPHLLWWWFKHDAKPGGQGKPSGLAPGEQSSVRS
jgi:hypothetical protein